MGCNIPGEVVRPEATTWCDALMQRDLVGIVSYRCKQEGYEIDGPKLEASQVNVVCLTRETESKKQVMNGAKARIVLSKNKLEPKG